MLFQAPKGTKDLLPQEAYKWHFIENKAREIAATYGCREIRTPMFEYTELFTRSVGETTDVVQKEMYTFNDKGNRSITLKAEGTAPAVRAFVEHALANEAQPTKLYYLTPVFRYENVQKGRLRQHHQFGVEVYGSKAPSLDAEIISLAMRMFKELGIKDLEVNINSIGCPECRKRYNEALHQYLSNRYEGLCHTCKTRFEKNPMRIIDCKEENCKHIVEGVPVILDYICEDCSTHFKNLKTYLGAMNVNYTVDPRIVRGLDYYTKTVFEILTNGLTLCGGGRYDNLIEEVGGPKVPAFGFGMGIERLIMVLGEKGIEIPRQNFIELYIGSMGNEGKIEALKICNALREKNINCECDHMDRSVKAQMKYANKIGARFTVILGDDEINNKVAKIKRMSDGELFEVSLENFEGIKEIIKDNV